MICIKYFDLSFIPFKINRKYNKALSDIISNKVLLFDKIEAEMFISKNCFNKTCITFKFDESNELQQQILKSLCSLYGKAQYRMGFGTNVWKVGKDYITHGTEETRLGYSEHTLSIYQVKPPFIVNSYRYNIIDDVMDKITLNWNLTHKGNSFIGLLGEVKSVFTNGKYDYLIVITRRRVEMYSNVIECIGGIIHSRPLYHQIVKYKDVNKLYDIICSYFIYMMGEDDSLFKARVLNVKVMFYSNKRISLPKTGYRPHIKLEGDDMFYGIQFMKLNVTSFDEYCDAVMMYLFPGVDYSNIKENVKFFINEGANCVGTGYVIYVKE